MKAMTWTAGGLVGPIEWFFSHGKSIPTACNRVLGDEGIGTDGLKHEGCRAHSPGGRPVDDVATASRLGQNRVEFFWRSQAAKMVACIRRRRHP